jgi:hypothetical protein
MARHYGAEQIQLKGQIRMAGRNHLVVDGLFLGPDMAMQASMTPDCQIAQIAHAELRLLVSASRLPIFDGVRSKPSGGGTMAVFATYSVADVEGLSAHLWRDGERVARQAFLVLAGRRFQVQNFSDANGDVIGQYLIRASVFVLSGPDAVFVLRHMGNLFGQNAAVATAGGASAWAVVFADDSILSRRQSRGGQRQKCRPSPRRSSLIRCAHFSSDGFAYTHSVARNQLTAWYIPETGVHGLW